jgi:hypothetical protein
MIAIESQMGIHVHELTIIIGAYASQTFELEQAISAFMFTCFVCCSYVYLVLIVALMITCLRSLIVAKIWRTSRADCSSSHNTLYHSILPIHTTTYYC